MIALPEGRAAQDACTPEFFDRSDPADEARLERLIEARLVSDVRDSIASQLRELVDTRHPSRKLTPVELGDGMRHIAGEDPTLYGTWVYYPWSGRLVHVLPAGEFRELRTSRNRNKITQEEQGRLARLRLGVAGLSVGQATALTLALEGTGGELRLADFDSLSLSNMNRLRAGVHEIGVNKAVITARAIWELNPYAHLELFLAGITEENIGQFLGEGSRRIDLLFEECDDLGMKLRLREHARALGIPVLMETSDRGLIDIERFDLEPGRPLLHGLVGSVDTAMLRGLSTAEKVPFILGILGKISPRAGASLVDIDATLKTWPQLASAVSLGAALNADVARRIALGQLDCSGRFYVDLEELIRPDTAVGPLPPSDAPEPGPAPAAPETQVAPDSGIDQIVRWASLAPSGGNHQPWRFLYRRDRRILDIHAAPREVSFLDFAGSGVHIAVGAAAENARLACLLLGIDPAIEWTPEPGVAARVCLGGSTCVSTEDAELAGAVETRATNRRIATPSALPPGLVEALGQVALRNGSQLELESRREVIDAVGDLVAAAEKLRLLHAGLHAEMMSELRWTSAEARSTGDGIDIATLELTAADAAGLRLVRSPSVVRTLREIGGGEGLKKPTRRTFASASAVGLLRYPGPPGPRSFLLGGQALERVWLLATARGVALQPVTALLALLGRLRAGAPGFGEDERRELAALGTRLDDLFSPFHGTDVALFRLAIAPPPSARSLRRPLSATLIVT